MFYWDTYERSRTAAPDLCSEVTIGHTLQGLTDAYSVQDWIGEGTFGSVAKCQALHSKQSVAVKILKEHKAFRSMQSEVSILEELSILDPGRTNLVHFVERFEFRGAACFAFEMLDIDLCAFMENRDYVPLHLNEIRPVAHQLLVALDALKGLGILHCDIKPDNVMFTDLQEQYLRVKLIDFGEARRAFQAQAGTLLQPYGYRAPEVTLGLPFTEAIDVWGVGCVLAFLYLGDNLFPVNCEYQMLRRMVDLLGPPPDRLLLAGMYSDTYFTEDQSCEGAAWRLMTPEEFEEKNGEETQEPQTFFKVPSCLDGLVNVHAENTAAKVKDKRAFVNLLKGLICLDAEQRLTPGLALQCPFITMFHLQDPQLVGYLTVSDELMRICHQADSLKRPAAALQRASHVADLTNIVQSDSSSSPSVQDSGVWSISEETHLVCSQGSTPHTEEPVCFPHNSELILVDTTGTSSKTEDTSNTPVTKVQKCFRRIFQRLAEVLCCCVHPQEDLFFYVSFCEQM